MQNEAKADHLTWVDDFGSSIESSDGHSELVTAMRRLQEAFTRARPNGDQARELAAEIVRIAAVAQTHEVVEDDQIAGRRWNLTGRGQVLVPPLRIVEVTSTTARAVVELGRFYGGRSAVHGGVTPMIFDELMGRLAGAIGPGMVRTAYLTVNYLAPAPLGEELSVVAERVIVEGRKRFLRGSIHHGATLVADAEGLWIEVRS